MPLSLQASDIALRLGLALLAGFLFGLNRREHGKPAGLRTMILVCLAAAIAMILANVLLPTGGKRPDSFAVLDMMRLPLGILTGIGFIGAGTILKKGDLVVGVTTAASVWFITVIGLALGAGQIGLGMGGLVLGLLVLWVLGSVEESLVQERRGVLTVDCDGSQPQGEIEAAIRQQLKAAHYKIAAISLSYAPKGTEKRMRFDLRWQALSHDFRTPAFLKAISAQAGITAVRWRS